MLSTGTSLVPYSFFSFLSSLSPLFSILAHCPTFLKSQTLMTSSLDVFAVYKYSRLRKSKSRIRDLSCNRKFIIRKYNSYHSSGVSPPGKGAESFVVSPWWRPRQIDGRSVGITLCYATSPENKSKNDQTSVYVAYCAFPLCCVG